MTVRVYKKLLTMTVKREKERKIEKYP